MRLEWIDDILAVLDAGSLAGAADKRLLTQSAFTRRVRTIEDSIGATLFDRSRKPVSLMPGVQMQEPELRDLSTRMHKLRRQLKTCGEQGAHALTFICQHALTATVSPQVVRALRGEGDPAVQVRSGNQDACLVQLLSNDVDFAIMYEIPGDASAQIDKAFDGVTLGTDTLIPVATPSLREKASLPEFPIVTYPPDVFLGQVFSRLIAPRLPENATAIPIAETSLTLAMQQLTLNEVGIAWLPSSLVANSIEHGDLVRLDAQLPSQVLNIRMIRLQKAYSEQEDLTWQRLSDQLQIPRARP